MIAQHIGHLPSHGQSWFELQHHRWSPKPVKSDLWTQSQENQNKQMWPPNKQTKVTLWKKKSLLGIIFESVGCDLLSLPLLVHDMIIKRISQTYQKTELSHVYLNSEIPTTSLASQAFLSPMLHCSLKHHCKWLLTQQWPICSQLSVQWPLENFKRY